MKKPGLNGAAIGGSVAGEDFSEPRFIRSGRRRKSSAPSVHPPAKHAGLASRFKGNGWLSNTIGNPLDTTIALQHLIFEGTLDGSPASRSSRRMAAAISLLRAALRPCLLRLAGELQPEIKLKKKPTEYLNQLYFDALVFTPEALRHLVAQVGASQIMLGTDHPIPWEPHPVDHIFATTTLSDDEKVAILGGNAARLFGMKA